MKYLIKFNIIFFSIVLVSSCSSTRSLAKEGITIIEGTDLFYEVKAGDQTYNFDINMNGFGDYISFDFDLGTKSGTVFIDSKAVKNATDLHNYFSNGYEELYTKTSVWVSKKLFTDLKAEKTVAIGLGESNKERFVLKNFDTYSFGDKGNGKPYQIPVFIAASKDSDKEIWIVNDVNNPLIVKMKLDFNIQLVDYRLDN